VPEIVTHGVTGLIGETDQELARLCHEVQALDRRACHQEALARFSPSRMAQEYERVYEQSGARSQACPEERRKSGEVRERWPDRLAEAGDVIDEGWGTHRAPTERQEIATSPG
jgi:hypothetical protein